MASVISIERALPFMSCTDGACNGGLELKNASYASGSGGGEIDSGYLACACGREYRISGGVPYFFDFGEKTAKPAREIEADIAEYAREGRASLCLEAFTDLAYALSSERGSDLDAMRKIFRLEKEMMPGLDDSKKAMVSQAATAARYNLENYRGCYTLPRNVVGRVRELGLAEGVIFEGAMATGENLAKLAGEFGGIAFGIDISERMARMAQENVRGLDGVLAAQGSLECIPLKKSVARLVNVNNVLDRIPDPPLVAGELGRIAASGGVSAMFNCFPLQFVSPDGSKVYVPEGKRMGLPGMTRAAGFEIAEEFGVDDLPAWRLETVLDGKERLIMEGVLGRKNRSLNGEGEWSA